MLDNLVGKMSKLKGWKINLKHSLSSAVKRLENKKGLNEREIKEERESFFVSRSDEVR